MRCLYCGNELALLKKLTGYGEFCSEAHRQKYQEQYNRLALTRLLQAQDSETERKPLPLSRTAVRAKNTLGPGRIRKELPGARAGERDDPGAWASAASAPPPPPAMSGFLAQNFTPAVFGTDLSSSPPQLLLLEAAVSMPARGDQVLESAGILWAGDHPDTEQPLERSEESEPNAELVPAGAAGWGILRAAEPLELPLVRVDAAPVAAEVATGFAFPAEYEHTIGDSLEMVATVATGSKDPIPAAANPVKPVPPVEVKKRAAMPLNAHPGMTGGTPDPSKAPPVTINFAALSKLYPGLFDDEEEEAPASEAAPEVPALEFGSPAVEADTETFEPESQTVELDAEAMQIEPLVIEPEPQAPAPEPEVNRLEPPAAAEPELAAVQAQPVATEPERPAATPQEPPAIPTEAPAIAPERRVRVDRRVADRRASEPASSAVEPEPLGVERVPLVGPEPVAAVSSPQVIPARCRESLPLDLPLAGNALEPVDDSRFEVPVFGIQIPNAGLYPLRPKLVFGPSPVSAGPAAIAPLDAEVERNELETTEGDTELRLESDAAAPVATHVIRVDEPVLPSATAPVNSPAPVAAEALGAKSPAPERPAGPPPEVPAARRAESSSLEALRLEIERQAGQSDGTNSRRLWVIALILAIILLGYLLKQGLAAKAEPRSESSRIEASSAGLITGQGGWSVDWGSNDGASSARQVYIFRPSMDMRDYRFEFQGQIRTKGLGWVFRAANPRNYYAMKLELVSPGRVTLSRAAVINGEETKREQIELPMAVTADTEVKIRTDAIGSTFQTYIQGVAVDTWTDDRLTSGGIGLMKDRDETAQVRFPQLYALRVVK